MTRRTLSTLTTWAILVSITGCDAPEPSQPPVERVRQGALQLEPGDVLLARHATPGMELVATPEPVREGTDPLRVLRLHDPPDFPGIEEGMRLLDAQWAGEEGLAVLGADRVLRLHTTEGVTILDREVLGPLSTSSKKIAYVYGEPPDLFVRVYDLSKQRHVEVTQASPAWSPALSEDGSRVLFTASHQGRPHLFVRSEAGELETIPTGLRTPSSARAPIWRGDDLFFEDERGVVHLDLETASIEAEYEGARLLPLLEGSSQVEILEQNTTRTIATWKDKGGAP